MASMDVKVQKRHGYRERTYFKGRKPSKLCKKKVVQTCNV